MTVIRDFIPIDGFGLKRQNMYQQLWQLLTTICGYVRGHGATRTGHGVIFPRTMPIPAVPMMATNKTTRMPISTR